jgi:hypothetical protein
MKYAPDGWSYFSVATDTVFYERLLPNDPRRYTAKQERQWKELEDMAEACGTYVASCGYERG